MMILRIWRAWLKKWACHAPLNFKKELAISRSILGLEEVLRSQNDEKVSAVFLSSKPWEISKNTNKVNKTSSKVMMILRIWRAWLKKWACHAPLKFKKEMTVSRSVLGLEEVSRCQNNEKVIAVFWLFITFCSSLNRFCSI